MVDFEIRVHPKQRLGYFPKELVEAYGNELKITPDAMAAIIAPKDARPEDILKSLDVLRRHYEMLVEKRSRRGKAKT